MSALAALLATWIFSFVGRNLPAPALASRFVLSMWVILILGWLNQRFNGEAVAEKAAT